MHAGCLDSGQDGWRCSRKRFDLCFMPHSQPFPCLLLPELSLNRQPLLYCFVPRSCSGFLFFPRIRVPGHLIDSGFLAHRTLFPFLLTCRIPYSPRLLCFPFFGSLDLHRYTFLLGLLVCLCAAPAKAAAAPAKSAAPAKAASAAPAKAAAGAKPGLFNFAYHQIC